MLQQSQIRLWKLPILDVSRNSGLGSTIYQIIHFFTTNYGFVKPGSLDIKPAIKKINYQPSTINHNLQSLTNFKIRLIFSLLFTYSSFRPTTQHIQALDKSQKLQEAYLKYNTEFLYKLYNEEMMLRKEELAHIHALKMIQRDLQEVS